MTDVFDDFNRAGPGLGGDWTAVDLNVLDISAFAVVPTVSAAHCVHYWSANDFEDDQFAQCTITEINELSYVGLVLRLQVGALGHTYYAAYYGSDGLVTISKLVNGTDVSVASVGITPTVGDIFRFEVAGTTLTAKVNGAAVTSYNDDSLAGSVGPYTNGPPGISVFVSGGPVSADDWSGGPIGVEGVLPVGYASYEIAGQAVVFRTAMPAARGLFVATGQAVNIGGTGADLRRRVAIRGSHKITPVPVVEIIAAEDLSMSGSRSPSIT